MVHNFDVENAKKYGMLEAVLISNFEFWIAKNKANEMNFFDGKYWVYNSARALTELFPYASEQQIKRALQHLKEKKVLISGNYNKNSYDRTLWYTFSDEYQSIVQNKTIDGSNLTDGKVDIDRPIPDNKTDNKTDNNNIVPQKEKTCVDDVSSQIQQIVDYLNEKTGCSYKASTQTTQTNIKARLKEGFTVDDFKMAIDAKIIDWGNDIEMDKYLRPITLFGTKFEGYVQYARKLKERHDTGYQIE